MELPLWQKCDSTEKLISSKRKEIYLGWKIICKIFNIKKSIKIGEVKY